MNDMALKTTNETSQQEPERPVVNRRAVLTPRVDILEQPEKLTLFVDVPGVKAEDVELNFERAS